MSLKICDKINKPSGRMDMDCMLENTKQCRQQYRKLQFVNSLILLFFPNHYQHASYNFFADVEIISKNLKFKLLCSGNLASSQL